MSARGIRSPFAGGVPIVLRWEALPAGYDDGAGCGCCDDCAEGAGAPRRGRGGGSAPGAKLSAKPGEDSHPSDPADEAQAGATNEVIDALGDGMYAGNEQQFIDDLASIQAWDQAQWLEPAATPRTVAGIPLPDLLDGCLRELDDLDRNQDRCALPDLSGLTDTSCEDDLFPSAVPTHDNLVVMDWDWDLRQFVYVEATHFETPPTSQDVDLLVAAWNLLVANADLAEWVACLVEGPDNGACVADRLNGADTQEFDLRDDLPFTCPPGAIMCTAPFSRLISIDVSHRFWTDLRRVYFGGSSTNEQRLCALVMCARALLHETLHSCLGFFNEQMDDFAFFPKVDALALPFGVGASGVEGCGCDTTDMADSAWAWAMARRYPCLTSATECSFLTNDCYFMNPCDSDYDDPAPHCY